jgi:hypothetical protein
MQYYENNDIENKNEFKKIVQDVISIIN